MTKQILHVFAEGIQMGSKQLKLNKEQKEVYVAFVVQFDRSVYNQYHYLIIVLISVEAVIKGKPKNI